MSVVKCFNVSNIHTKIAATIKANTKEHEARPLFDILKFC